MRTHSRLHVGTCGALVLLAFSFTARGQTPATSPSLEELAVLVGAQVEVVDSRGSVFKGRLIEASETGVLLNAGGRTVRVAAPRIEEVSRRLGDPLWNGALVGAAIGAAPPLIWSASVDLASGEWTDAILVSALYGGIGAGIGATIDALIQLKKTVLFRAAVPRIQIVPTLSGRQKGVALSVRF